MSKFARELKVGELICDLICSLGVSAGNLSVDSIRGAFDVFVKVPLGDDCDEYMSGVEEAWKLHFPTLSKAIRVRFIRVRFIGVAASYDSGEFDLLASGGRVPKSSAMYEIGHLEHLSWEKP